MKKIKIKKLVNGCILPKKAHDDDAGYDLYAYLGGGKKVICSGEFELIPTGFSMELPHGTEAQIRPRSGLAVKHGITVLNSPGTVDFGYSGEIKVCLINHSKQDFLVEDGMRIAQMVICDLPQTSVEEVDCLSKTDRGNGGFGSTGR